MGKIEISTPEPEKTLLIIEDAIERQKHLLAQSLARTQERIEQLTAHLQVSPDQLLAGILPHPEEQDMDLLELEGELEILRHLREQLACLDHLSICL
jgi:hypothetical protein